MVKKSTKINNQTNKGEIIIYRPSKNEVSLKVRFENENIWLAQAQIASLFGTQRPAITKHLKNVLTSGELNINSVSSILEHTASDGKTYKTRFYNLDAIVSIGYRVNSKQATPFRIWATKILKQYLQKGYVLNQKRLQEVQTNFYKIQEAINFLQKKNDCFNYPIT